MSPKHLKQALTTLAGTVDNIKQAKACLELAALISEEISNERADIEDQVWRCECAIRLLGMIHCAQLVKGARVGLTKEITSCAFAAECGGAVNTTSLFQGAAETLESLIEQWEMSEPLAKQARELQIDWFKKTDAVFAEHHGGFGY